MLCCEYIDDFTTLAEETLSPAWPVAVELPPKQRVQQAALEGKKNKKKTYPPHQHCCNYCKSKIILG